MNACREWKQQLRDAALGTPIEPALEQHVKGCATCAAALAHLRVLREQIDAGVRELARSAGPSPGFHARLMAALPDTAARLRWRWVAGSAVTAAVVALAAILAFQLIPQAPEAAKHEVSIPDAATLTQWRSPTDALLRAPGQQFLRGGPRLGELYFPLEPASRKKSSPERSKEL